MPRPKGFKVQRREERTPIATGMYLPNHSGDHSAGKTGTPVNSLDLVNKAYVDDNIIPAGNNTEIQYNDGGAFAGDSTLTFNKTTKELKSQKIITEASGDVTREILRTNVAKFIDGIDASDSNAYKLGDATGGKDPFGTDTWVKITTAGNMSLPLQTPAADQDTATKKYVDDTIPTNYLKDNAVDVGVGLTLTGDNDTNDTIYVPNVLHGTDATPPTASTVPRGTIYIQYTA